MIDPVSRAALLGLLRRESRTLLQYVSDAFPWITPEEQDALACFQTMVQEECKAMQVIARFLAQHRVVPESPGPYPMNFTTINFVSLDHLIPLLAEAQRRRIAELEAEPNAMPPGEAREYLENYLSVKRNHLETLAGMAKSLRNRHLVG